MKVTYDLVETLIKDHPWVPSYDVDRLFNKTRDFEKDMETKIAAQEQLELYEDPVLHTKTLKSDLVPIGKLARELHKQPKPKEPEEKKEKKEKKKKKKRKGKKNDESSDSESKNGDDNDDDTTHTQSQDDIPSPPNTEPTEATEGEGEQGETVKQEYDNDDSDKASAQDDAADFDDHPHQDEL